MAHTLHNGYTKQLSLVLLPTHTIELIDPQCITSTKCADTNDCKLGSTLHSLHRTMLNMSYSIQ